MTLFSAPNDPWSHRTRIVLAEKGISIDIVSVEAGRFPEDLLDLNPYHSVPTLVDRDLVLYDSRVIIEYLDERFPHPPLMPVDPVSRAQFRLALYRIERDWYGLARQIDSEPDKKQTVKLKKILRDTILQSTELFKVKPYFLSDEFSLVDATIAPVLWRLPYYEIEYYLTPLASVAKETRQMDPSYVIGNNNISKAFIDYAREKHLPIMHFPHVHNYFSDYEIKLRETGEWVKLIDKGRLTVLDDPDVVRVAALYGEPAHLLDYDWIPTIPGINYQGTYESDYAPDPVRWIRRDVDGEFAGAPGSGARK